jgi:hypothetical protein
VVLPSFVVHFACQLGYFITERAHARTHMFECVDSSS